jgi:CDP-diacylglycerol--glycerol-3-phosphate 3-phosphatidyltransferase/cardiolipin synthase
VSEYRVNDLVLLPNLLSGARIPLAIAFPLAAGSAPVALGVLGFAGLTDVLDGWAARKLGQTTPVGALVDGVADKIFAASVLGTLVATGMLSPASALLLATRELAELPLALRVLTSKRARLMEIDRKANRLGKVATVLEFATVLAVIGKAPGKDVLLAATAVCGAAAAASYWLREIRALRPSLESERRAHAQGASEARGRARGTPPLQPAQPATAPGLRASV